MRSLLFFLEMVQRALGASGLLDSPPTLHDLGLIPALALCLFSGARTTTFVPEKCCLTPISCSSLTVCNHQQSLAGAMALQLSVFETSH